MPLLTLGIIAGLGSATFQAFSYIFSRKFVLESGHGAKHLLVLAHFWMLIFSLILMPFFLMAPAGTEDALTIAAIKPVIKPLIGTSFFYFCGQGAFFWTVKQLPASRISPLLGAKIIFLGILGITFFGKHVNGWQWVAIAIAGLSAVALNFSGEALKPKVMLGIALTCTGYALSDLNIPNLVASFDPEKGVRAAVFSVVLVYTLCGIIMLPFVFTCKLLTKKLLKESLFFAFFWYGGMCFLFAAISSIGVVLAVILQSLRGIFSLIFGKIIASGKNRHLEQSFDKATLIKQSLSACMMILAATIYICSAYIQQIINYVLS